MFYENEGEEEEKQDSGPMSSADFFGDEKSPEAENTTGEDRPHPFDLFEPAGSRIVEALKGSPYIGLDSLNALTDEELIAIKGIGQRSVPVIRGLLASEGYDQPAFEPIEVDAEPIEIPDDQEEETPKPRQPPEDWPPPPDDEIDDDDIWEEDEDEEEDFEEPPPPEPVKETITKKVKRAMSKPKTKSKVSYVATSNLVVPNWEGKKYNFVIGESLDDIPAGLLEEMKNNGDAKKTKSE
jgi:hypothetical protein